jgi:hypothetical protein
MVEEGTGEASAAIAGASEVQSVLRELDDAERKLAEKIGEARATLLRPRWEGDTWVFDYPSNNLNLYGPYAVNVTSLTQKATIFIVDFVAWWYIV